MAELRAYAYLKARFPAAHFQRLETWAGVGVPDINACFRGVEAWVECKEILRPAKASSPIRHPKVREAQIAWETHRRFVGGRTFVALMLGEEFRLLPGYSLIELKAGCFMKRLDTLTLTTDLLFDPSFTTQKPQ